MTVIDSLHAWLRNCPAFQDRRLDIDCLKSDPDSCSLDSVPGSRIVTRYIDGSTVRRQLFTVSSRAAYGPDLEQQRENLQLFEDLESWIDTCLMTGALPALGEKRRTRSLSVLSTPYPIEADEGTEGGTARYQIQLEIIYLQEV